MANEQDILKLIMFTIIGLGGFAVVGIVLELLWMEYKFRDRNKEKKG